MALIADASSDEEGSNSLTAKSNDTKSADGKGRLKTKDTGGLHTLSASGSICSVVLYSALTNLIISSIYCLCSGYCKQSPPLQT